MKKLTLKSFNEFANKLKNELKKRNKIILKVGMGTCGIAAGAEKTLKALKAELEKQEVSNYEIKKVGCMGLCYCEPNVEVIVPGMPKALYGNVDEEVAKKIVIKHVVNRKLVSDYLYDIPSADILEI